MLTLQQDINRLFDTFWRGMGMPMPSAWNELATEDLPRVDVRETDKEVVVSAELPGMDEKDVEISVAGGLLSIRGETARERETENDGYVQRERTVGAVERLVPLPDGLDLDSARATMKNGLLTVKIPRAGAASSDGAKQISIQRS
ncbi:MAG TPA: Hsp20/alpha crystallin family protein [Gammaproteobacteria bacterium]|nr:Hsp20/alpha crystallin family protein [Gammaproteobacteria bacterium]